MTAPTRQSHAGARGIYHNPPAAAGTVRRRRRWRLSPRAKMAMAVTSVVVGTILFVGAAVALIFLHGARR